VARYDVEVVGLDAVDDVPGRVHDSGLRELAVALGGADDPDRDAWDVLGDAFRALGTQELGERLMEAVLWQPPIPAYCETLLHKMATDAPPWIDHDVPEDRFNLWYAHHLAHRVFPDTYPAPLVRHVTLDLVTVDPAARPLGKRSPPRDRTTFAGRVLLGRQGDNPLVQGEAADTQGGRHEFSFDAIWAVEAAERVRLKPEELAAMGLPTDAPAQRNRVEVWMPAQWLGDLSIGARWTADA
jgi:hypothetical protein